VGCVVGYAVWDDEFLYLSADFMSHLFLDTPFFVAPEGRHLQLLKYDPTPKDP
jgi:hypothetical protein